jgi:hypothetical protein
MTDLKLSESVFIQTANTRNLSLMMDDIRMDVGEGRFGVVCGPAGLGKSRAVKWYHANSTDTVYLESTSIWKSSDLAFLRDLCRELGIVHIRNRKEYCFRDVIDFLNDHPQTIILIDEVDRLSNSFLELARDITRMTVCPIIFIGEKKLLAFMQQNERVWTRTFAPVMFTTMKESDVIIYAKEVAGLALPVEVAGILHQTQTKNTEAGNFRLVKRALIYAIAYANAAKASEITPEIARMAIKSAVRWAVK